MFLHNMYLYGTYIHSSVTRSTESTAFRSLLTAMVDDKKNTTFYRFFTHAYQISVQGLCC